MQNRLTKITLKPLLHQIKSENLLLSIDRMTKYTYIVILNDTQTKWYTINDTQEYSKWNKIYMHFCKL